MKDASVNEILTKMQVKDDTLNQLIYERNEVEKDG